MGLYKKAITFSYDDGVVYDNRLIEIFNKYGIKATFNINTGVKGEVFEGWKTPKGLHVRRNDFNKRENIEIYNGHEVAVHTRRHLWLDKTDDEMLLDEIIGNKQDLEEMFGRKVVGMAYPFNQYDERTIKILYENGFLYAREGHDTYSFEPQKNLLKFRPTCHHNDKRLFELADKFLNMTCDSLQIFYIWGHSYEFEDDSNWDRIETFCKFICGRDDILYGTNKEVFELQRKFEEKTN